MLKLWRWSVSRAEICGGGTGSHHHRGRILLVRAQPDRVAAFPTAAEISLGVRAKNEVIAGSIGEVLAVRGSTVHVVTAK